MKLRGLSLFLLFLLTGSTLYSQEEALLAQDESTENEVLFEDKREDPDMDALRKWIREKRLITVKETGGDLSISGDIRTEFSDINEKKDGIRQRGHNAATDKPARPYKVAFNLLLDYRTERTWTAVKLGFKNDMGIQDGTTNKIRLSKAYFGGRMIAGDTFTFDGELGRRSLGDVYDSRVQFSSLFDGALLRFSKAFESIGDYYTNLGIFLINTKRDYYGYVAEMGFLNIGNTGFLLKASYIDWKKYHRKDPLDFQFNFRVSQLLLGYQFTPEIWPKLIKFYAAGLYNDAADRIDGVFTPTLSNPPTQDELDQQARVDQIGSKRYNWAWYAGVSIGQARKKGDWAVDTSYQWVQAQAIPDFDVSGIGRGNAAGVGMYTMKDSSGTIVPTTILTATGNANYHGWVFKVLYAFTDNITFSQRIELSNTLDKEVGPDLSYKQFRMEGIFTF